MEEYIEDKTKVPNYCDSCKKYHKLSIDGTCPICGGKLTHYRPNRHYFKKETKEQSKLMAKLIQVSITIEKFEANFRMMDRKIINLEARYQQIINLLKGILRFRAMSKRRLTITKIIEWIERVVDEPEEKEIDLVDELVNPEQVEKELK